MGKEKLIIFQDSEGNLLESFYNPKDAVNGKGEKFKVILCRPKDTRKSWKEYNVSELTKVDG